MLSRGRLWIGLGVLTAGWIAGSAMLGEAAVHRAHRDVELLPEERADFEKVSRSLDSASIAGEDGAVLRGWFLRAREGQGECVILLHGVSDTRRGVLGLGRPMLAAGYSVLMPDSRAHGESGGGLVTFGLLERDDVQRWATWMKAAGCTNLFGLGESMGAAILIQAAAEKEVFSAIVAESPYSSFLEIAEDRVQQRFASSWFASALIAKAIVPGAMSYDRLRYGIDLWEVSPERSAKRLQTPLLLIHGLADTNIVPRHSERIMAAASPATTELWLVPDAIHTQASAAAPAEYRERVLAWFRRHASPPPPGR